MDEEARLEALRKYRILDTAPEPQFDRVAEIARRQFDVPVALVAFMDSDRNFLKAHGDLPFEESPRAISFCGHTILDDRVLVVGDATRDPRFAENPLVVGDMALRFYAGAPLITPSGHRIGTVCLFDVKPREDFDEAREGQLRDLASIVVDHLEMRFIVGNVHDEIETRRAAEAEAWSAARTDALTGLPNRTALNDLIEGRLPFAVTGQLAVFYADIDGFEAVNAAFGHQVGDEILQTVATKVTACMGEGAFVARASGDEFIVVFDVDSALVAEAKAAELIAQVTDTRSVNRVAVSIGLTVGIALGAIGEAKTAALIREADIALYEAKRAGRNRARIFDDSMAAAAVRRRLIEHDLPEAMVSGAIAVHFQPVVRASTREMIGVEALARWRHPLLGDVSPLEFVGIAEETGQVRALGRHILRTALIAGRSWSSLFVSVNLSPLEFRLPDLAEEILATLEAIDFPPARLEVEVTERLLLDDLEATRQQIVTLHDHGIKVALDDFGTGYSSLSYLRTIPFDKVKIDRSFVTDIGTDDTSAAIVECVANLARQLNIDVTAEGVDTEDQEILLRAAGCGTFQGYRFGRPMPAADLDTRYRRQAEPAASIRLVAG